MADIRAFRGFRYDLGRAGSLSEVPTEPVDLQAEMPRDDTEPDQAATVAEIAPTRPMSIPQGGLPSTKDPAGASETRVPGTGSGVASGV